MPASELMEAYHITDYCFTVNNQEYTIRFDDENVAFTFFLEANRIEKWAFITAWNPYSVSMPITYNTEQQQLMLPKLEGCKKWKGEERGRDGCWTPEESYFVADINREEAIALGQEFGLNAILVGGSDGKANLIMLFDSFRYIFSNGRLVVEGRKKRHTHYLDNLEINPIRLGRGKALINSEGPILSLHEYNHNLYLSSHLKDGSGKVYYATNKELLHEYYQGKITIKNLIDRSPSRELAIKHFVRSVYVQVSQVLKDDFNQEIQYSDYRFTDLPPGMAAEDYLADSSL
ncbi:DUF3293 domain-containing protein [Pontibacter chinhatensis]|uniref:DUF3293 domain-containing protein n=1 Tax=Pontibacter chinhatensis TaxID=1436961 RepID=A0A1I2QIV9_9BACT|nr:DUF3293 domain-containing protein [Pontibacter chinhatensis]SFG28535.1 Protein of unknown function [Pontibacter chinhatensis]